MVTLSPTEDAFSDDEATGQSAVTETRSGAGESEFFGFDILFKEGRCRSCKDRLTEKIAGQNISDDEQFGSGDLERIFTCEQNDSESKPIAHAHRGISGRTGIYIENESSDLKSNAVDSGSNSDYGLHLFSDDDWPPCVIGVYRNVTDLKANISQNETTNTTPRKRCDRISSFDSGSDDCLYLEEFFGDKIYQIDCKYKNRRPRKKEDEILKQISSKKVPEVKKKRAIRNKRTNKSSRTTETQGQHTLDQSHYWTPKAISRANTVDFSHLAEKGIDSVVMSSRSEDDRCCICLDNHCNPVILPKCSHAFCKHCIETYFKVKPTCPVCFTTYGIVTGNQPNGTMTDAVTDTRLPGYESYNTIVINYRFQNGTQTAEHPNPGVPYMGTSRVAYLPNCPEGQQVLRLLKESFRRRLTFTIGRSRTTGMDNTVTWNDIHHKTCTHGGMEAFGYPDPTYLSRVQEELAAKGVTQESLNTCAQLNIGF